MTVPALMPEPNALKYLPGFIRARSGEGIFVSPEAERELPQAAEVTRSMLGLRLERTGDGSAARIRLRAFEEADRDKVRALFGRECDPGSPVPESYLLEMDPEAITVAAADPRGFFYALQTLRQLVVERAGDARGAECGADCRVKRCVVFDYPHVSTRGVHVYLPARGQLPFCRRFIDGLAALKYNRIYFETSGLEYKRHPEINQAWLEYVRDMDEYPEKAKAYQSASHGPERPWYKDSIHIENAGGSFLLQEEVRELVAYCRARMIEVVPEVQSLSHCDYLVIPHREIAEIPEDPYPDSYCPSNPKSYELLFDVLDEVVDVFRPKMVNIGHDEWYTPCYCPACRKRDAAELLAEDVTRIHDHLASKGIATEMWGDKLLDAHTPDGRGQGGAFRIVENYSTSEVYNTMPATWRAVGMIPKDVRIGNWYWNIEPGGFDWYARHGLRFTGYNNFFGPDVKDWEVFSRRANVLGATVSHWDLLEEENMAREGTLTNIVYSSFPMWNQGYTNESWVKVRDLTLEFMPAFAEIVGGRRSPSRSCAPREQVTAFVRHEKRDHRYMDASVVELRSYFTSAIRPRGRDGYFRDVRVTAEERAQSYRIAMLNDRVDSLVFRHTTSIALPWRGADHGYRLEDYRIGCYRIGYADGTEATVDLSCGGNIGRADADWGRGPGEYQFSSSIELLQAAYRTRPWIKTLDNAECVTVYDYEWVNPRPDQEIRSISLSLEKKQQPFSVFVYDIFGIRQAARERDP